MLENKPLITVYIVTYNRESLISRAIESVLEQTYSNIELIVVNDGSVDNTGSVLQEYADQKLITYLKTSENVGACAARNLAIHSAKGEYITGLDDDDEFTPHRVEVLFNTFKDSNYSCISSGVEERVNGHRIKRCLDSGFITKDKLYHYNALGNQVFTKTEFLKGIGGFDVNMPAMQDYDTWIRLVSSRGTALKIKDYSYILHKQHGFERISNNMDAMDKAFDLFLKKHGTGMNQEQLNSMKVLRKKIKGESYNLTEFFKFTNSHNFLYSLTLYLHVNFKSIHYLKLLVKSFTSKLLK